MTYIELYDKTHIANVCAMLANPPDRVVFVGEKHKTLEKNANRYKQILARRGYNVEVECAAVNKNNISAIIELLCSLVEKYEDCHFDLGGGEDLFLCAAGIVFERYRQKGIHINMHRFNIRSNRVLDCDLDGVTVMDSALPTLSVAENIAVWGGGVLGSVTCASDISDEDKADILTLWDIMRSDVKAWNRQVNFNAAAQKKRTESADANIVFSNIGNTSVRLERELLEKLKEKRLIEYYSYDRGVFRIEYKSRLVRKCLTVAGLTLELAVLVFADMALDGAGERVYNDACSGIMIDWDGVADESGVYYDAENELDVMLMHGVLPVFISCKNGDFDVEELYKLNSVSMRFGREYAKKVIIATALDSMQTKAKHIRERAADMDIRIIDDAHLISHADLIDKIGNLWR